MQSYSIDPSVFYPPDLSEDDNQINIKKQLKEYFKLIEKCYEFIHKEGISVYIFHHCNEKRFDDEYKNRVNKTGLPVDIYKKRLDDILLFNMPELHIGNKIGVKKYYFEEWFDFIKNLNYSEVNCEPLLEYVKNHAVIDRINVIGILNNYIYNNSLSHFLVLKEKETNLHIEVKQIYFLFNNKHHNYDTMDSIVQTQSVLFFDKYKEKEFDSVNDVYEYAKKHFSEHIIFGNDVTKGINTIRNTAGPPNRIFSYLETLTEYCKYKRKKNNNIPDDIILNTFGCICSYESEKNMEDKK